MPPAPRASSCTFRTSGSTPRVHPCRSPWELSRGVHLPHVFTTSNMKTRASSNADPPSIPTDKPVVAIAGGGLIACACAYFLQKSNQVNVVLIERVGVASAASGKGGGFLARDWGDGSPTEELHRRSFQLHEELAETLQISTYRKIPTLSVSGGKKNAAVTPLVSWLDGDVARCRHMDGPEGTAQVTPRELCEKLHAAAVAAGATSIKGEVCGVAFNEDGTQATGLYYQIEGPTGGEKEKEKEEEEEEEEERGGTKEDRSTGSKISTPVLVSARDVVIAMGPWSTRASEWFGIKVPMTGIRSTSIIYPASDAVMQEPAALFCGEDANGCHLEVYPRSSGEVYLCGIGGSVYVDETGLLPGGECDRSDKITADPRRVQAAMRSFGGLSRSIGGGGGDLKEPMVTQACMRPCAPDALPILGPIDGIQNAYLATAHNCWGILWSPVTGEIISQLITEGKSDIDIRAFSPTRFMGRNGKGRGRKMRDEAVGEQW